MTDKQFLHQLRRGIGSAIIELKQNDNRKKYKEIVYRCCLKDIGYDPQVEGTKGYYLYTAISALGCEDEFLEEISKAYIIAMGRNRVLPDKILLECQFDSYDETRKYANMLIKRRSLEKSH